MKVGAQEGVQSLFLVVGVQSSFLVVMMICDREISICVAPDLHYVRGKYIVEGRQTTLACKLRPQKRAEEVVIIDAESVVTLRTGHDAVDDVLAPRN